MRQTLSGFLLAIALASTNVASSFESFNSRSLRTPRSRPLFGTIKFVGTANALLSIPPPIITGDEDKSLSKFLSSPSSDTALLGRGTLTIMDGGGDSTGEGGLLWECRQASVRWFGMEVAPIFINRIDKNPSEKTVVVSIIDARTEVEQGGRLGNVLASAMQRSTFSGRNAITWKEYASDTAGGARSCDLEGNLKLTLTITLPPFLPLPPGFNTIGSKIVERTCTERLRQNLSELSDAYLIWATSH